MSVSIRQILSAASDGVPGPEWADATERIRRERDAVDAFLASGGRAYGFTTRLGHLDGDAADEEVAAAFLADHLHGATFGVPREVLRVVCGVKLTQLAHGGSGISPELFDAMRRFAVTPSEGADIGAWNASYGAGDVVPASWWLTAVLTSEEATLRTGDFIAAVNGDFVSTGFGILASARAVDALAAYLAIVPPRPQSASVTAGGRARDMLALLPTLTDDESRVQPALSERDPNPFVDAVVTGTDAAARAIEARLTRPSANPLFVFDGSGGARALSQNGFLDFGLTFGLTTLTQAVLVGVGHVQRLIEHAAVRSGSPALVQVPKIAEALVARASATPLPRRFSGSQSQGIEDAFDQSLLTALGALTAVSHLEEILDLASMTGLSAHADVSAVRDVLGATLGMDSLPAGRARAWTAPLTRRL